jgi:CRP/FNR family cyclic AMP-dependent transcriptional regulator
MFTPKGGKPQGGDTAPKTPSRVYKLRPRLAPAVMARDLSRRFGYLNLSDLIRSGEPAALDRLFGSEWARFNFKAGDTVYPMDWCNSVLLGIERGSVNLFLESGPDRLLVKRLEADAVFGEMPSLGIRMFGAIAQTATGATLIAISSDAVERAVRRSPRFLRAWWHAAGRRFFESEGRGVICTHGSQPSRAVHELVELAAGGDTIRITHQQLADRLGAERVSVSSILADLERKGLISVRRGAIVIKDPEGLRRLKLF